MMDTRPMKRLLLRAAAQALLLASVPLALPVGVAEACVITPLRNQHIWLQSLAPAGKPRLPREQVVQQGDLISLMVPAGTQVQQVSPENEAVTLALPLAKADFQRLSSQGGGRQPAEVRDILLGKGGQWLHFAARQPGLAYLKLSLGKETALIRLTVEAEKIVPRGRILRANENQQDQALEVGPEDALALTLPGKLADPWNISMDSGAARLTGLWLAEGADAERVTLSIKAAPDSAEGILTLQQGGQRYRFFLRRLAVPKC